MFGWCSGALVLAQIRPGSASLGWVVAGLFAAIVVLIAATLPYGLFRQAFAHTRRPDGRLSRARRAAEVRHVFGLAGDLLFAPVLFTIVLGGVLAGVHLFVTPIPLVADVFGAYDPDPVVWEENIEERALGDVGAAYDEWSRSRGYAASTARFWQEALWDHWPWLLELGIVLAAFIYWFVVEYYLQALVQYQQAMLGRRRRYRKEDGLPVGRVP